jgi:ADP-heptose:LPS heptosyltransferase
MIYILLTWLFSPLLYLRLALRRSNTEPREILLIQTAKIGDFICTTPLFREIKRRYPQCRLSILLHPINAPLAAHNPHIDVTLCYQSGDYRGLRGKLKLLSLLQTHRFDTTICVSPNLAFMLMPLWAGIPRRLAILPNFGGASYRLAAPFLSAGEPHASGRLVLETEFRLLRALDIQAASLDKEVYATPEAASKVAAWLPATISRRKLIGIGLSSGNKMKELGTQKLCSLIRPLLENAENSVVLIGGGTDREQGDEIMRLLANDRTVNSAGIFSLAELPALLTRLALYIGVDSGITYMADALKIPVIDIMGPADADDQRPTGEQAVVLRSKIACAPCSHAFRAPYQCGTGTRGCITDVDLPQIANLAMNILTADVTMLQEIPIACSTKSGAECKRE